VFPPTPWPATRAPHAFPGQTPPSKPTDAANFPASVSDGGGGGLSGGAVFGIVVVAAAAAAFVFLAMRRRGSGGRYGSSPRRDGMREMEMATWSNDGNLL
jgi:hypothetical protein